MFRSIKLNMLFFVLCCRAFDLSLGPTFSRTSVERSLKIFGVN